MKANETLENRPVQVNFYRNFWTFQVEDITYEVYSSDEFNAKRDLIKLLSVFGTKCTFDNIKTVK